MSELFESKIHGRKTDKAKTFKFTDLPPRVQDLHRNTKRLSQAIIKVSSYSKSHSRAVAHAEYITRQKKDTEDLPVEMSDGSILYDAEDVQEVLDGWFAADEVRENSRRCVNIVLSSPCGSDVEKLKESVREFVGEYFQKHESMFVIHTDTNNPHAHLTVKMRSHEGEQLRLGKLELKEMKDLYAEKLCEQDIEVHSSYRSDRGQWVRGVTQAQHHQKMKESADSKKIEEDNKPESQSLNESLNRTKNEYYGAALFLRKSFGLKFESQAKDLERFANQIKNPQEQKKSTRVIDRDEEIDR